MEIKFLKEIKTTKEECINIIGVTLLEKEDYLVNKDIISFLGERWWTRTPADFGDHTCVEVIEDPNYTIAGVNSFIAVRPALIVSSVSSRLVKKGDKYLLGEMSWTAITGVNSNILLLADESIGRGQFRAGVRAADADDYEKSKIKKWLEEWYEDFLINYKAS